MTPRTTAISGRVPPRARKFLSETGVNHLQPPPGDRGEPVPGAGDRAGDGPRRVRVAPPVHRFHEAILEVLRGEEGVETVRSVSPRSRTICHRTPRSGTPGVVRPILPPPPAVPQGRAEKAPLDHRSRRHARRVGQRVVVGDMRLLDRETGEEFFVSERVERHGSHPHRRPVPGVPSSAVVQAAPSRHIPGSRAGRWPPHRRGPPKANGQTGPRSPQASTLPLDVARATQSVISVSSVTWPGRSSAILRR